MSARDPFDFGRSAPPDAGGSGYGGSGYGGYGGPGYGGPGYGSSGYGSTGGSGYGGPGYGGPVGTPDASPSPAGPAPADDLIGQPPIGWLLAALVLGVGAAVIAGLLGEDVTIAGLAWLVAGPIGIALVAVYSRRDTAARARPIYNAPGTLGLVRWACGIALAAGVIVSALRIAEWAGRL